MNILLFPKKCSSRFTQLCKFAKLLQELHFDNIEHICLYESRHYPSFTYPCSNLMKELRYQFKWLCFVSLPKKKMSGKFLLLCCSVLHRFGIAIVELCNFNGIMEESNQNLEHRKYIFHQKLRYAIYMMRLI